MIPMLFLAFLAFRSSHTIHAFFTKRHNQPKVRMAPITNPAIKPEYPGSSDFFQPSAREIPFPTRPMAYPTRN